MLTILMSKQAQDSFGSRMQVVLNGLPFKIVNLDAEHDSDGRYDIDLAFLSRDVTANSGKTILAPSLTRYYEIVRASPRLSWIQAHAAGFDRPIFAELNSRGVLVTTGSGTASVPVAQMAITGLLALARCLPQIMKAQQHRSWEPLHPPRTPTDISEQTVVVVGLGPIGKEIGRLCDVLGMSVYGIGRTAREEAHFKKIHTFEQADAILKTADYVVLACPLTDQTRGFLNAVRLRSLPSGAKVINVARGEVIVESDLIQTLQEGRLGGAFLDVFNKEPLDPQSPLWSFANVIVSPHSAAHTSSHYEAVGGLFLQNLERWRNKKPMLNVADFST